MKTKKIFLIGNFSYPFYEPAFSNSLKKIGFNVIEYKINPQNLFFRLLFQIEEYFSLIGPFMFFHMRKMIRIAKYERPEIVFFWRPILIDRSMITKLKIINPSCLVVNYQNDNPFGRLYQKRNFRLKRLWKNFIKTISSYDINIVYRNSNIEDYKRQGAHNIILFPPAYIPSHIPPNLNTNFLFDVVFIGHSEEKRVNYINYLLESGISVKIFGTGWDISALHHSYGYNEIIAVYGNDYYQMLYASKINLAFLSDLNEDVYTRRNFEIPGMGGLMLSERTSELESFFKEGEEAFFFSSKIELLEKVKFILDDNLLQVKIRLNAKKKSIEGGYDIDSRVKKLMIDLNQ
jgi:spore maturation protein CgeB